MSQHKNNLDYISITRIYELDSINDILNLEDQIKKLSKELKINYIHNSGIEYFKVDSMVKLNNVLDKIDQMATNIKSNNSLLVHQSKMDSLILIEMEKTKQAEIDYLKTIKTLELQNQTLNLQNENLKLQIKLTKLQNGSEKAELTNAINKTTPTVTPKSKIQEMLDSKISNNNNQTNSTQIINSNIIINETADRKCMDCGCNIAVKSVRCGKCENNRRLKQSIETNKDRPTLSQLQKDLETQSYVQVGKKYGVSDNCIRKWIHKFKSYNKLTN